MQTSITSEGNPTQPLLQAGLTSQLPDQGKDYRDREKSLPSRAMRCLHAQARSDTELHIECTDSLQNSVAQNVVSRGRSRRRLVLSALGSLSRGCREWKKDSITASHNYVDERIS